MPADLILTAIGSAGVSALITNMAVRDSLQRSRDRLLRSHQEEVEALRKDIPEREKKVAEAEKKNEEYREWLVNRGALRVQQLNKREKDLDERERQMDETPPGEKYVYINKGCRFRQDRDHRHDYCEAIHGCIVESCPMKAVYCKNYVTAVGSAPCSTVNCQNKIDVDDYFNYLDDPLLKQLCSDCRTKAIDKQKISN
ncbi:MAG TPA: hypothetical protein DEQ14_06895 [Treponema sp.]|nr:hypothetical protein [Treponema sp.]